MDDSKTKTPRKFFALNITGYVLATLLGGIVLILISKYFTLEKTFSDILFSLGIASVTASTIGILAEFFLELLILKKISGIEQKFLDTIIPKLIETTHDWVSNTGRRIPVEKDTLYNLLKIGYIQWFMKEDFTLVTVPIEQIAELYQKTQLYEFKEPVYVTLKHTFTCLGNVSPEISKGKDLISINVKTEFSAVNTSDTSHKEDRYVNRNGILASLNLDAFEGVPKTPDEIDKYLKRINLSLKLDDGESQQKIYEVKYVAADYVRYLRKIKDKNVDEIIKIIKEINNEEIDKRGSVIYVLYHFFDREDPEISGFYYIIFCPFPIEPQKSWCIKLSRTHSFAQNDYFHNTLSSLTKGLTVHVQGFENTHRTAISEHLMRYEPEMQIEHNLLNSTSLIVPKSSFIVSWQKK